MERIPLRLVREGMILGQPVLNASGGILLGEGVELTDRMIERLTGSGVHSIVIQGGQGMGPRMPERVLSRLDYLFRKADTRFMQSLKGMLRDYFERKVAELGGSGDNAV